MGYNIVTGQGGKKIIDFRLFFGN